MVQANSYHKNLTILYTFGGNSTYYAPRTVKTMDRISVQTVTVLDSIRCEDRLHYQGSDEKRETPS
jgi:hypothetical protein